MPITTKYVFIVSMDVAPEKETLFNEVYDREHVTNLLKVPGVRSVTRLRTQPGRFTVSGQTKPLTGEGYPGTRRFARSTVRTSLRALPGPRQPNSAAGRPRSVPTQATGIIS